MPADAASDNDSIQSEVKDHDDESSEAKCNENATYRPENSDEEILLESGSESLSPRTTDDDYKPVETRAKKRKKLE